MQEGEVIAVTEPRYRFSNTLVLAAAAVGAALVAIFGSDDSFTPLTVTAALAGLVPWALVAGGVRLPLWLFATLTLGAAGVIVVADANGGGVFPAIIAVVFIARSTDDRITVGVSVVAAVAMAIAPALYERSTRESGAVYFVGGVGISFLAGRMLRRQEILTAELQAMHGLQLEHAAVAERTHIAREVHDVVAHSLTIVMLHLTGARRVLRADAERADEALARAEQVGRSSLESVRTMVGLLRADAASTAQQLPPQPALSDLTELIERSRAGGLTVTTDIDVDGHDLDPARQLVIYRVVQESLSNVLQHAPGATCRVRLRSSTLEVTNDPPPAPREPAAAMPERTGLGVVGMAERVRAIGGTFRAGPTASGGWQVAAEVPARTPEETWATT